MNEAWAAAEDFELSLGDPFEEQTPFSFATTVARDDREEFPEEGLQAVRAWGFHRWFVPVSLGGKLGSYEELLAVVRCVTRRDLSLAIAHGTALLSSNPVWMWGSEQQRRTLAELVLSGAFGSFGVSEAAHGSDLLGCELRAERQTDGLVVTGEKWPIGNATRGRFVTLFARTSPSGGPRGFSLLIAAWVYTLVQGYLTIRRGQVQLHRIWMIRNYGLTFAAVLLRLFLAIGLALQTPFPELGFDEIYPSAVWASVLLCVLVPEYLIVQRTLAPLAAQRRLASRPAESTAPAGHS